VHHEQNEALYMKGKEYCKLYALGTFFFIFKRIMSRRKLFIYFKQEKFFLYEREREYKGLV